MFSFIIHDSGIHSILDQLSLNYISSSHQTLNHIDLNDVVSTYTKIDENFAITFFNLKLTASALKSKLKNIATLPNIEAWIYGTTLVF